MKRLMMLLAASALILVACDGSSESVTTSAHTSTTVASSTTSAVEPTDGSQTSAPTSTTTETGAVDSLSSFAALPVGGCFNALNTDIVGTTLDADIETVNCTWAHEAEVFAVFSFDESEEFPSTPEARNVVANYCDDEFEKYVGNPVNFSSLYAWPVLPTRADWDEGIRVSSCVLIDYNGDRLRGSAWQQGW